MEELKKRNVNEVMGILIRKFEKIIKERQLFPIGNEIEDRPYLIETM
ncbi:MAG: hypothetical protein ACXABO_18945 [Promethearchaeota archaeon]